MRKLKIGTCSFAECTSDVSKPCAWTTITEATSAGGRDWTPLWGKTLCMSCYSRYRQTGRLEKGPGHYSTQGSSASPGESQDSAEEVASQHSPGGKSPKECRSDASADIGAQGRFAGADGPDPSAVGICSQGGASLDGAPRVSPSPPREIPTDGDGSETVQNGDRGTVANATPMPPRDVVQETPSPCPEDAVLEQCADSCPVTRMNSATSEASLTLSEDQDVDDDDKLSSPSDVSEEQEDVLPLPKRAGAEAVYSSPTGSHASIDRVQTSLGKRSASDMDADATATTSSSANGHAPDMKQQEKDEIAPQNCATLEQASPRAKSRSPGQQKKTGQTLGPRSQRALNLMHRLVSEGDGDVPFEYRPFADNGKKGKGKIYKATLDGEGLMLDIESGHKHTTPMKWAKECKEGATGRKCNGLVAILDYIFYKDKTLRQYDEEYEEEMASSEIADAATAVASELDSLGASTGESPAADTVAHPTMLGKRIASEIKAADDNRTAEGKKRQATLRSPVKTPIPTKGTSSPASAKAASKTVGGESLALKADVEMEIEDTTVEAVSSSPKDGKKKRANSKDVASEKVVRGEHASKPAHKIDATARGGQGGFVDPLQAGAIVGEEVILSRARSGGRSSSSTATGAATVSKRYRYRLVEMLGTGKVAEVWRCDELATGRQVAVKFQGGNSHSVDGIDLSTENEALCRAMGQGVPCVLHFNESAPMLRLVVGSSEKSQSNANGGPSPAKGGRRVLPPKSQGNNQGDIEKSEALPGVGMLVLELLGDSMERVCHRSKGLRNRAAVAIEAGLQLLAALERVHGANMLHNDLSLSNILVGNGLSGKRDSFFLVDFGIASGYWDTSKRAERRQDGEFNGTQDFVSLGVMQGEDVSRKDDLEALVNCLICFINGGKLPWTGAESKEEAMRLKKTVTVAKVCKNCPAAFAEVLKKVRCLKFHQRPDYRGLRTILEGARTPDFGRCDLEGMLQDPPIIPTCLLD